MPWGFGTGVGRGASAIYRLPCPERKGVDMDAINVTVVLDPSGSMASIADDIRAMSPTGKSPTTGPPSCGGTYPVSPVSICGDPVSGATVATTPSPRTQKTNDRTRVAARGAGRVKTLERLPIEEIC